jgi:hypothetical protein
VAVVPIIVSVQIAMGLLIGFVEGWSLGDAVHFTFVTGLILLATISCRGGLAHEKAA